MHIMITTNALLPILEGTIIEGRDRRVGNITSYIHSKLKFKGNNRTITAGGTNETR